MHPRFNPGPNKRILVGQLGKCEVYGLDQESVNFFFAKGQIVNIFRIFGQQKVSVIYSSLLFLKNSSLKMDNPS